MSLCSSPCTAHILAHAFLFHAFWDALLTYLLPSSCASPLCYPPRTFLAAFLTFILAFHLLRAARRCARKHHLRLPCDTAAGRSALARGALAQTTRGQRTQEDGGRAAAGLGRHRGGRMRTAPRNSLFSRAGIPGWHRTVLHRVLEQTLVTLFLIMASRCAVL